jgi:RND family efflux transporter MFP subunit
MEVDRAEQALRQAEDRQRLATLRLATLRRFEQPAAVDQARAQLGAARKSVGAATETARSKLAQRRAAVALAAARAADARLRLANARAHVERTTLRAATSGLIVYRELFFGTDRRKPQPGDEVWPNQPLVAVPDPANLIVQTRVREIDLHRIFTSQRVTAFVDAYPGLRLPATVGLIGALAQEDASRAGTRFFPVTIRLAQADARLRTGMTARVEIEVSRQPDVTLVPVEALIEEDGAIRCRVARGPRLEMRDVEVAARNDTVAWIRRGLSAGEMVVTADLTRTER